MKLRVRIYNRDPQLRHHGYLCMVKYLYPRDGVRTMYDRSSATAVMLKTALICVSKSAIVCLILESPRTAMIDPSKRSPKSVWMITVNTTAFTGVCVRFQTFASSLRSGRAFFTDVSV